MNLLELLKITKGKVISGEKQNRQIGKICIDSRIIEKNDIFIAIIGKNTDGNNYIKDVINTASAIITTKKIKLKHKTPIIKVKDIKKTITKIGKYNRKKHINKPLIAITGSVGKTTTKELISEIFKTKYNILKTKGNYNNDIGVPIMLSQINDKHEIIILELGMNHLKEIKKLSKICKPTTSIITNIGTSHIGNLKTQKNILKAKLEIIIGMKKGTLIVNGSDKYLSKLKKNKKYNLLKTNKKDVNNIIINDKLYFNLNLNNKTEKIHFNIPNKYLIENILLATLVSQLYQIPVNNIIEQISKFKSINKRTNIINLKNNITLIDDCYNASLESIKSSLSLLENINKDKIAIIGDVLELGTHSKKIHEQIEQELLKIKNLNIITVGKNIKVIKSGINFNTNNEVINYLEDRILSNNAILIKGSRGMHLEEIKDYLTNKYSL